MKVTVKDDGGAAAHSLFWFKGSIFLRIYDQTKGEMHVCLSLSDNVAPGYTVGNTYVFTSDVVRNMVPFRGTVTLEQ